MTAAAELLHELTERGVTLVPAGEHIRVKPRELLTDVDRERIRACKPDLLALLAGVPPDDAFSNGLRAGLLLWGGPLGWPSLVEVGLGDGANRWTAWLMLAGTDDVRLALTAAERSGTREHPDPRWRLASWAIDRQYPRVPHVVRAGMKAWERFINEGSDDAIAQALAAVEGQAVEDIRGRNHGS